jgi:hypothetical protein
MNKLIAIATIASGQAQCRSYASAFVLAHTAQDDRLLTIPYRRHPIALFVRKDHRPARLKRVKIAQLEDELVINRDVA